MSVNPDKYLNNSPSGDHVASVSNVPLLQRDPNPGGVGTYGQRIAGTAMDIGIARTLGSMVLAVNPELWPAAAGLAGGYLAFTAAENAYHDATHQEVGISPEAKAQMATVAYMAATRNSNVPSGIGGSRLVRSGFGTSSFVPAVD